MRMRLASTALLVAATPALFAHDGFHATSFAAGFSHPLGGLDHLLAMLAVGILAVRCAAQGARQALWQVPAAFVGMMVVGGLLSIAGMPLPWVELGVALSVLVFGVLIALASAPTPARAAVVVGFFALLHGHAHGSEMSGSFAGFAAGFVVATSVLHAVGIAGGLVVAQQLAQERVRLAGGALAVASLALVAQCI